MDTRSCLRPGHDRDAVILCAKHDQVPIPHKDGPAVHCENAWRAKGQPGFVDTHVDHLIT